MCGLTGFVITDSTHPSLATDATIRKYMRYFERSLYLDVVRGEDSTGVAAILDNTAVTYKKAVPAYDFLDMRSTQGFLYQDLGNTQAMLGHNRAATQGKVNHMNSHPFTHGDITLMHNGTLYSEYGLEGNFEVDSEGICYTISKCDTNKEVVQMLESLYGAFALVWFDKYDNTVNFARNEERPLEYVTTPIGFLYASEDWILRGGISDPFGMELATTSTIKSVPVGEWRKVHLDTGVTETIPFVPDGNLYGGDGTTSGTTSRGTRATSAADIPPELTKLGVQPRENLLVKVVTRIEPISNPSDYSKYGAFVCEVVSQADVEVPPIKTRVYPKSQTVVKTIEDNGFKYLSIEPGGWWLDQGEVRIFCQSFHPVGTKKMFNANKIERQFDAIFDAYLDKKEALSDKDETKEIKGEEVEITFFDAAGIEIDRSVLEHYHNTCAWCGDPFDLDKDEFTWMEDNLVHDSCAVEYSEYLESGDYQGTH